MHGYFANASAQLDAVIVFALAAALGGLLGVERELANKPAGFRTLMLVSGTSALLMRLGEALYAYHAQQSPDTLSALDPTRVIQAIIMGIGFICAGTIIRRSGEEQVEGLTTSAVILVSAAIGMCVALKQLILAFAVTVITLIILIGFRTVEAAIERRKPRMQKSKARED